MGKNFNPVDAHRKAQRARELKKNKDARKDKRDTQLVKKDTRDIEKEIKSLKSEKTLHEGLKSRLEELEKELKHITAAKEKYVKEHPEEKDKIFKPWSGKEKRGPLPGHDDDEDGNGNARASGSGARSMEHLYDDEGKLRDPKRSLYYDAVYNPFGVPPPGMPYRERSEEESDDESDDEIVMPSGPPPGESDEDSDDSDDIPLPPGPPPPKPSTLPIHPPPGPGYGGQPFHARPPNPVPVPVPFGHFYRPPPAGPPSQPFRPPPGVLPPRPPISAPSGPGMTGLPSRPPTTQTSISAAPTSTSIPPKPISAPAVAAATISAEPVMRDLRKESTIFVPRNLKRKKAAVNAAPGGGEIDADGDELRKKRDDGGGLMGRLKGVLGEGTKAPTGTKGTGEGDDDYQDFLKGLGDLS